jgi:HPt (histidine-containing phosphotransfer) domain-containing protein
MKDFDIKIIREFTHHKQEHIVSTLHLLSESLINDQKKIATALINNDIKNLKFITHRTKSNFHLLGLKKLGKLCAEVAIKDSTPDEIKKICASIVKKIPAILGGIEIELKKWKVD